jgi:hypothetical protein
MIMEATLQAPTQSSHTLPPTPVDIFSLQSTRLQSSAQLPSQGNATGHNVPPEPH